MGVKAGDILYYLVHVQELRSIIQWKTWHEPIHERHPEKEPETLKKCYYYLDQTSRSFAAVIKELHPELLTAVVTFYLVLRGLDTIEDDMTIPLKKKDPELRNFYKQIGIEGWNYNDSGPDEADRGLLVEFENVTAEYRKLKPAYQKIIDQIAKKMGEGMADYCNKAEHGEGVETTAEYDEYCWYVAGLVGEGCTRLFVEGGLANPALLERQKLHNSMGLLLQKVNIIRDIHEDFEDNRRFWPKEIWSKHVDKYEDLFNPAHIDKALLCSSEMILNALEHVEDCLYYLAGLKEQSVFNFCAIPQSMAIATLDVVFQNPKLFRQNVKISKGSACQLMLESTQNHRAVCAVFKRFCQSIQKKNDPRDPNFLKITLACSKVEQFIEGLYPTTQKPTVDGKMVSNTQTPEQKAAEKEATWDTILMFAAVIGSLIVISAIMVGLAWLAGARFDVALNQIAKGKLKEPTPEEAQRLIHQYDRGEL